MIEKACKWFCDNFTPILITVIGGIIVYLVTTAIKNGRKIDFKGLISYFNKFWQKIREIKSSIFNRIREKIVGKENLELLKELKPLKDNKIAINFLTKINESSCNISRESILINFTNLYYLLLNNDKIKEDYEKDRNEYKTYDTLEIYVLKKLIEETIACDVK